MAKPTGLKHAADTVKFFELVASTVFPKNLDCRKPKLWDLGYDVPIF